MNRAAAKQMKIYEAAASFFALNGVNFYSRFLQNNNFLQKKQVPENLPFKALQIMTAFVLI